jgi:hypothetical protein
MVARAKDLWSLAYSQWVDPQELRAAVEDQVIRDDLDYRSRVLICDSLKALRHYWGDERVEGWLNVSPVGEQIKAICRGPWDDDRGFFSLMRRIVEPTEPDTIRQYFRELSQRVPGSMQLIVGGSVALCLLGYLSRRAQGIDVAGQLPYELHSRTPLLKNLAGRYGLELLPFEERHLPSGWQNRLHRLDTFGGITVDLVDAFDIFLSKLFSDRNKDRDDLHALRPQLDKETLARRLHDTCGSMLVAESLRQRAEQNWYVLYGESLPT